MKKIKFEWEELNSNTDRCKVVGGWIVRNILEVNMSTSQSLRHATCSMVFVPDPNHKWEVE